KTDGVQPGILNTADVDRYGRVNGYQGVLQLIKCRNLHQPVQLQPDTGWRLGIKLSIPKNKLGCASSTTVQGVGQNFLWQPPGGLLCVNLPCAQTVTVAKLLLARLGDERSLLGSGGHNARLIETLLSQPLSGMLRSRP